MESRSQAPRPDELKVWVDGFQRVVCGINDKTTVQEVVIALAQATGQTGRYTLVERWRNSERLLPPSECPLGILNKWGQYAGDVQFVLRRSPDSKTVAGNPSSNNPPSLKQQTSTGSIPSNNHSKFIADSSSQNFQQKSNSQNFQQYQLISSSTLPNHYNQLRQNSTLSAQALKNHTLSKVQNHQQQHGNLMPQISAPVPSIGNSRHQAHVKKIEQDIEQHARLEYFKVIEGQQTSLDELEQQLKKFNLEISKLDTAIRSYRVLLKICPFFRSIFFSLFSTLFHEFKRIHSSSSVTPSNNISNFHQRSGSAPLSMDNKISLNSTLQLKQQEIANLEHQIRENEKFLSAHDILLKKPGSVQDMLNSLNSDISKNNSSVDQVLFETQKVLHTLGDTGRVSANTEDFLKTFEEELGRIEKNFKNSMNEITKMFKKFGKNTLEYSNSKFSAHVFKYFLCNLKKYHLVRVSSWMN